MRIRKVASRRCASGAVSVAAILCLLLGAEAIASEKGHGVASSLRTSGDKLIDKTLRDEALSQTRVEILSLDECIQKGIKNNFQVQANRKLVEQSEWNLIAARRQWYPSLSMSSAIYGGYTSFQESLINSGGSTSTFLSSGASYNAYEQFSPALSVTWYFANPAIPPSINSALAELKAQRFTYDYILRGIILQIQTAYINVQSSLRLVDAYKKIYASNKQQVDYLEAQLSKGMVDIGAVAQSKTTMYQQLASLVQYQQTLANQGIQLAQLIGYKDKTVIIPNVGLTRAREWEVSLEESISRAINAREEIKQYLQTADSYKWQARQLLSSYVPALYLTYNGSINETSGCLNVSSKQFCPNTPSTNNTWSNSISLGVTWNIDGGQNMANANANKKAADANVKLAENQETLVAQQIKSAFSQYKIYGVGIDLAERQLKSATLNSDVSAERLRVGVGDITTVVQAQQLLSSAVQTEVQALQQFNIAIAQLNRYAAMLPEGVSPEVLLGESNE